MSISDKPILNEVFADNGAHSHWELIHPMNGKILWTEDSGTEQPIPSDIAKWIEDRSFALNDDLPDVKVMCSDQVGPLYSLLLDKIRGKDEEIVELEKRLSVFQEGFSDCKEAVFNSDKEIERLKVLIENIVKQTRSIYPKVTDPNKAWQQFKNENKL